MQFHRDVGHAERTLDTRQLSLRERHFKTTNEFTTEVLIFKLSVRNSPFLLHVSRGNYSDRSVE